MLAYSLGECAYSLIMNGILGFAMLYYTRALGLSPALAGLAMSLSVFWEVVTEPIIGQLSDRTRSRFGRRHPWIAVGGLLMAICFYLLWAVPRGARGNQPSLFAYLMVMNLLVRTGLSMFYIPYMALGFEMVTDYQLRARLQGLRQAFNMGANFAGPAMAWILFFGGQGNVDGLDLPANYHKMAICFSAAAVLFVAVTLVATWSFKADTNLAPLSCTSPNPRIFRDIMSVALNPLLRWVFLFVFAAAISMVLLSSLQPYLYVDFMELSPPQRFLAYSSTIAGMASGALLSSVMVRRFDKRPAILIGGLITILANLALAALFLLALVPPAHLLTLGSLRLTLPVLLFVALHATFWLGNGLMLPVANSMVADVSEIHQIRSGMNRDASYAAMFSLALRLAIACSLMLSGSLLQIVGYEAGANKPQSAQAISHLGAVTFLLPSCITLLALLAIRRYSPTRESLTKMRQNHNAPASSAQAD